MKTKTLQKITANKRDNCPALHVTTRLTTNCVLFLEPG